MTPNVGPLTRASYLEAPATVAVIVLGLEPTRRARVELLTTRGRWVQEEWKRNALPPFPEHANKVDSRNGGYSAKVPTIRP